jgi:hypothetical protein
VGKGSQTYAERIEMTHDLKKGRQG